MGKFLAVSFNTLAFYFGSIKAAFPHGEFQNVNCLRTISLLDPQQAKETISVVIQNTGSSQAGKYFFYLSVSKNKTMSTMLVQTKAEKIVLPVNLEKFDTEKEHQYYSVLLSPPLRPEGKVVFNFKFTFLQSALPFPESIGQTESASYKYIDNVYFSTPYLSTSQKTVVKLSNSKPIDYTRDVTPVAINDATITYGPYSDIEAFTKKELMVHFSHSTPLVYVRSLFRDLEVSHWGNNLAVEEHFAVDNVGPRFKGSFSRLMHTALEYQKMTSNFVKSFEFNLPALASDAYFRDEIGNVSTSNFRSSKKSSHLYLEPRYPLYGGWNYTWYHGYNLPLSSSLKQHVLNPNKFVLTVPLLESLSKSPVLDFTFRAVLPEGATDVKIESFPIDNYRVEYGRIYSYLDTVGRPTVTIYRKNVVKQHWVNLEIHYNYNPINLLLKPLAVFAALMGCFLTATIVSRLNLHLGSTKFKKQK